MKHFNPSNDTCPESGLCPICKNNDGCETPCKEYKQMSKDCEDIVCKLCKWDSDRKKTAIKKIIDRQHYVLKHGGHP